MTGYTVHTGSSEKFSDGWDQIFKSKGKTPKTPAPTTAKKTPPKRGKGKVA